MTSTKFSKTWKESRQTRKQRKYRFNAPLHVKNKFIASHLSKELKEKHKKRSITLRRGDKIIVTRGQFSKKTGKVDRIDTKKGRIFVTGIEKTKKDGTKVAIPLTPSNLMITELNLEDKKRKESLDRK
ncbi:50S ribosomal protein L24 [Candidatus Woesearchaeota archaeon]|nr:50S ribosomal protein L24 [Candidatus Woesearchaeota archaeon]